MKQPQWRYVLLLIGVAVFLDRTQFVEKVGQFVRGDWKLCFVVFVDSVAQSLHNVICSWLNRSIQSISLIVREVFLTCILALCSLRSIFW